MTNNSYTQLIFSIHLKILTTILLLSQSKSEKFQPYNLNGGLISAIAGKNYILIASDTRFSNGSYDILSRQHLQSRLYKVSSSNEDFGDLLDDCSSINIPNAAFLPKEVRMNVYDGVFIGSSGCASDSEALKRHIITEIQSITSGSQIVSANCISNVLGQILYSRRSFPFYSFCITAGFDGTGVVHVYDAIGSNERVAVGAVGNGKELLQPILDRLFSTTSQSKTNIAKDGNKIEAEDQVKALDLLPPVKTYVDCEDVEEAIGLLLCGYRSVAEREISVGDDVVVCIVRNDGDCGDGCNGTLEVRRFPLKKH